MSAKEKSALSSAPTKADTDKRAIARLQATQRDMVMTWDEINDELIWDEYDVNGPEHQPISPERLEAFCKRFPHFADRLRGFVKRWNEQEQLTPDALAAVEVKPEQLERTRHFAFWCLRFYDKLHHVEKDRDELGAALRDLYDAVQRGDFDNIGVERSKSAIAARAALTRLGDTFDEFLRRTPVPSTHLHDVERT